MTNADSYLRSWLGMSICIFLAGCISAVNVNETSVQSAAYWSDLKEKMPEDRIILAPDAVVEYVLNDNIKNNYPNRPFRPSSGEALLEDVRQAFLSMPESVRALARKKLAAIVLIGDLGTTGYSEIIRDEKGSPVAGFIALDVNAIDRMANDWASWKENSPFKWDGSIKLSAVIENDQHNNRVQTIQYILLHELGHVLAIGENFHPPWDKELDSQRVLESYPFAALSWSFNEQDRNVKLLGTEDGFGCYPLQYYAKSPSTPVSKALTCYKALEKTSLISLYAGTNLFDDFAEAFAHYVHTVLLGKPWSISISESGNSYRYEPNWNEERFKSKRLVLESFLR